jgi:hypothetical protein
MPTWLPIIEGVRESERLVFLLFSLLSPLSLSSLPTYVHTLFFFFSPLISLIYLLVSFLWAEEKSVWLS